MEMTGIAPASPAPLPGVAPEELADVLRRLRRSLRRRVRGSGAFPPLQEAQLELIRLLSASPGLRVQQAAATLQLRPNTVSTLVAGLVRLGLVARVADPADGRAVRLELTAAARRRISHWRDTHHAVLGEAMTHLDGDDLDAVAGAMDALRRLATRLEEDR